MVATRAFGRIDECLLVGAVFLGLVLVTGCARSTGVVGAQGVPTTAARFAARQPVPPAPRRVDEPAATHAVLAEDDVAALDALREVHASRPYRMRGEHIARALPFECVRPFTIGICAVPPERGENPKGDSQ